MNVESGKTDRRRRGNKQRFILMQQAKIVMNQKHPCVSMCMSNVALKVAGDVQSDDSRTGTDLVGNDDEQCLIEGVCHTSTCPIHSIGLTIR